MVNAWAVIVLILGISLALTHGLQKIPTGRQALLEKAIRDGGRAGGADHGAGL